MGLHRTVHSTLRTSLLLLGTATLAGATAAGGGVPTADRSPALDAIIAANGGGFFPEILVYTGSGPVATDGEDGLPHINTRIGGPADALGVGEPTLTSSCQPPAQLDEEWGFWLVEDDFYGQHYERCDYFLSPEGFDEVQISGFQVGFEGGFVTCSQGPVSFRVRVYSDINGQPSSLLLDQTVAAVGVPGPVTYAGTEVTRLYTWTLPLSGSFDIQRGWLSVQATGGGDCFVGQLTSAEGMDNHSLFKNGADSAWEAQSFDLNYCLVSHTISAPSCQPASLPSQDWGFWLTDGAFGPRAERFQVDGLLESVILTGSSVAWNGVAWQSCNTFNNTFHLTFYSDVNGAIGQPVANYILSTPGESNGQVYYWTSPFFSRDYTLELPAPLNLRTGWLSVRAVAPSGCWFVWLNSQAGDGSSLVWNASTQSWRSFAEDFAFCTTTVAWPPVDQVNLSTFNGVITLDWLPMAGAQDYQVLTAKNPYGAFLPVEGTTGGATSYSVAMDGTMDFFKVVAICD